MGIRPEHLKDAMPLKQVQKRIQDFLCNGEPMWKIRPRGGKARILVGHGLDHDLDRLQLDYPSIMIRHRTPWANWGILRIDNIWYIHDSLIICKPDYMQVNPSCLGYITWIVECRDTAKYPPLMKTSKLSNSLKYLTQAYLGYMLSSDMAYRRFRFSSLNLNIKVAGWTSCSRLFDRSINMHAVMIFKPGSRTPMMIVSQRWGSTWGWDLRLTEKRTTPSPPTRRTGTTLRHGGRPSSKGWPRKKCWRFRGLTTTAGAWMPRAKTDGSAKYSMNELSASWDWRKWGVWLANYHEQLN